MNAAPAESSPSSTHGSRQRRQATSGQRLRSQSCTSSADADITSQTSQNSAMWHGEGPCVCHAWIQGRRSSGSSASGTRTVKRWWYSVRTSPQRAHASTVAHGWPGGSGCVRYSCALCAQSIVAQDGHHRAVTHGPRSSIAGSERCSPIRHSARRTGPGRSRALVMPAPPPPPGAAPARRGRPSRAG
ncbi:hypothetical protein VSR01_02820 [Actinacidiphila sp. DG2A-62]|uniref:hypothetical protein n=1 Tax=Actinacidiphila sp. DG2A-62 TaxID=3108821 RepID=UPI002DB6BCB2|nr:hypothetical protein [Actinacidiphila sp. DG2A-62]MEC3992536.1 hypothetical protein [Actinacidiphila sp. DG2A-62]